MCPVSFSMTQFLLAHGFANVPVNKQKIHVGNPVDRLAVIGETLELVRHCPSKQPLVGESLYK